MRRIASPLVASLVAGLVLLLVPAPGYAATFVVDSNLDEVDANPGDGTCASAAARCTLRAAVMEANALGGAQTVTLPASTYTLSLAGAGDEIGATGDLDIYGDLTIQGAGAATTIVDAAQLDRIFDVHNGRSLSLSGMTLRHGRATAGNGGAILVTGTTGAVTIAASDLRDNQAPAGEGGAVYSAGTAALTSSTVATSTARAGGGVRAVGAVTVTGTTVATNTASDGSGGGIFGDARVTVSDSTITGNHAAGSGGGVNARELILGGSTVSENVAGGGGGLYAGDAQLTDSTVADNQAAAGGGMAVGFCAPSPFSSCGGGSLVRVTLRDNRATTGSGGGASFIGTLGVEDSTLTGNGATLDGGAVSGGFFVTGAERDGHLIINGSTVRGNTAGRNGGGVSAQVTATSTTFAENVATGSGGGIYAIPFSQFDPSVLTNSQVVGNTAGASGGGVFFLRGTNSVPNRLVTTVVSGNTATAGNGGGVTANNGNGGGVEGSVEMTDSWVTKNTATAGNGGGLAGPITATGGGVGGNYATAGSGGGIYGTAQLTAVAVFENVSGANGGGIDGAVTLVNSTVSGNEAAGTGGGLNLRDAVAASSAMTNVTIAQNAAGSGSGVAKVSMTVQIKNTVIAGNTGSPDCFHVTPFTSLGHNLDSGSSCGLNPALGDLIGIDPKLGQLAINGGPTPTQALLRGSPAIDAGDNDGCPATDQRGQPRPLDGNSDGVSVCDIGAYEAATGLTVPPSACSPRPPVAVATVRGAPGDLTVTIAATGVGNGLVSLRFENTRNATVNVAGQTGLSGTFAVQVSGQQVTFTIHRVASGQAVTVPLVVVDQCGPWPTLVGGGPSAF